MNTNKVKDSIIEGLVGEWERRRDTGDSAFPELTASPMTEKQVSFARIVIELTTKAIITELMNGQVGYDLLRQIINYRVVQEAQSQSEGNGWIEGLIGSNSMFKIVPHSLGYSWEFREGDWYVVSKTFSSPLVAVSDFLGQLDRMIADYTAHKIGDYIISEDQKERNKSASQLRFETEFW